jgi:hypothetical protein
VRKPARDLHVWGAGLMLPQRAHWPQRLHWHAVRGRLTAREVGIQPVLADPGILASILVAPQTVKHCSVGLVPHHVDADLVTGRVQPPLGWRIIRPDQPVDRVLKDIAGCEIILSSSLHGLIVADAFRIPCIWLRPWGRLYGASDFKFRDYETARLAAFNRPLAYEEIVSMSVNTISDVSTKAARPIEPWQRDLIAAFPFR